MSERPHDLTGRPLTLIPPLKIKRKCVIKDVASSEVIVQDDVSRQGSASASSRELGERREISEEYEFQKMAEIEKRLELEKRFEVEEELELQERLEKYCHFFTDEPPMDELPKRCIKDFERVHREWYDDLVFRRLRKDLKHAPEETGPTQYRSWAIVQEFWDDIRKSLSIEDSEFSTPSLH
ncbi:hypothetical protein MBM_01016 [Drepanopeziza brunnea f. sp. 'multigermtubi' MB_m1]|uniref:Uncharacterized protein n=1 Tax=Marssonina brunnea f. sp. multigermtubi (strain MB_m1) TaxID=1072389 RepID=K1Y587_MARBU|nr:uncharacterized protein MBM_01016 [Drepanopeziza brunnea f. sp. 'multigermtubi' MB_m1]EKD20334.1 hypothetical protein MBM_01016 [Drepanopeziza brunnea f. sp. 'multigermtubi' MB_m1]